MSQDHSNDGNNPPPGEASKDAAGQGANPLPGAVTRAWRALGDDEPPALLDQAVLNRARAAVEQPAPHSSRPWSFGWIHTLTTAAVIVLGVTLVLQLGEESPVPPAPTTAPATAPKASADTPSPEALASPARSFRAQEETAEAVHSIAPQDLAKPAAAAGPRASDEPTERSRSVAGEEPDTWLAEIRALFDAGRKADAREEFERFREAWPDYPLPEDFPTELLP